MVKYLLEASEKKMTDTEPLFFNCDKGTILMTEEECALALSANGVEFHELIMEVRKMARTGMDVGDVYELIARTVRKNDAWMLHHAMKAFQVTQPAAKPAFVPAELDDGSLLHALLFQRAACAWLERGPIREADGLWIKAAQGSGKTLLLKLLQLRYQGQVFTAATRGATGCYDVTSMLKYAGQRIVIFNSLKPGCWKGETHWSRDLLELLELLTDGLPVSVNWANACTSFTVVAKIIVVSTHDMPETRDIVRRYSLLEVGKDSDDCRFVEHPGNEGTPSDVHVMLREGLDRADCQPLPTNLIVLCQQNEADLVTSNDSTGPSYRPEHGPEIDTQSEQANSHAQLSQTACNYETGTDVQNVGDTGAAGHTQEEALSSASAGCGLAPPRISPRGPRAPRPGDEREGQTLEDLLARFPQRKRGQMAQTPPLIDNVSIGWRRFVMAMEKGSGLCNWMLSEVERLTRILNIPVRSVEHASDLLFDNNPFFEQATTLEGDIAHFQMCVKTAFPQLVFVTPTELRLSQFGEAGASLAVGPPSPSSSAFAPAEYDQESP